MAFPTAVATSGGNSTGDSTPTIALPDNAAVGDLMLIAIRTGQTVTVTWPASPAWVELFEDGSDASNDVTAVAYRRVDGTEGWGDTGNTIDLTLSSSVKSAYVAYKISGAIDPATQAPQHSTVTVGTGATIDPVSLTPTGGAKDYLWLLVATYDGVEVVGTAPSGYSNAVTGASSTGAASGNASVACCQRAANAASEEPGTWTIGGAGATVGWSAWTFAIHPSAAAAYTLTAASGSFALTGQTASLLQGYAFPAASGSFTLAGQTTGLLFGHLISSASGSFTLAGETTALLFGHLLSGASSSFALTGQSTALLRGRLLAALHGAFALTCHDATLVFDSGAITVVGTTWIFADALRVILSDTNQLASVPHSFIDRVTGIAGGGSGGGAGGGGRGLK